MPLAATLSLSEALQHKDEAPIQRQTNGAVNMKQRQQAQSLRKQTFDTINT